MLSRTVRYNWLVDWKILHINQDIDMQPKHEVCWSCVKLYSEHEKWSGRPVTDMQSKHIKRAGQFFGETVGLQSQLPSGLEDPSQKLKHWHATQTYEWCWSSVLLHIEPATSTGVWIGIFFTETRPKHMNTTGQLFSCKVSLQSQLVSRLEDPSKKLGYRHTTETYGRCWPGVQLHNVPITTTGEWIGRSFTETKTLRRR